MVLGWNEMCRLVRSGVDLVVLVLTFSIHVDA